MNGSAAIIGKQIIVNGDFIGNLTLVGEKISIVTAKPHTTRHRILGAATQLFARRGYGEASVSDIAAEAGVSMGALYHHFTSKEELFRTVVDEHLRADLREIASLPPGSSFRELLEPGGHPLSFGLRVRRRAPRD